MERLDRTALGGGITMVASLALILVGLGWGLEPTGAGLAFVGLARLGLLAGVLAFVWSAPRALAGSRLRSTGLGLACVGAPLTLLGALVHGVVGGWGYNPFEDAGASPPAYSMAVGLGAFAFALGAVLLGTSGLLRRGPRTPSILLLLGGILYLPAIPLLGPGHALWALPWLALGAVEVRTGKATAEEADTALATG